MLKTLDQLNSHYQEAIRLTKVISGLAAPEQDKDELARALRARKKVLAQAALILRKVSDQGGWSNLAAGLSPAERERAAELTSQVRQKIEKVQNLSRGLMNRLGREHERLGRELASFSRGERLLKGYKGVDPNVALCLERRA